jgi:hypothetical protein
MLRLCHLLRATHKQQRIILIVADGAARGGTMHTTLRGIRVALEAAPLSRTLPQRRPPANTRPALLLLQTTLLN